MVRSIRAFIGNAIILILLCSILMMSITACSGEKAAEVSGKPAEPVEITVFAAASLTGSFGRIGEEFEKQQNGRVKVLMNFAGSQELRASIEAGAHADIFTSADVKNMDVLINSGFVESYKVLAENSIAVVLNKESRFEVNELKDLGKKGLMLAVADESVPVGKYWTQALDQAVDNGELTPLELDAINKAVATKELNVKDVLSKVVLGEADVGVVYGTDAIAAGKDSISVVDIPGIHGIRAVYPAAVLKVSEGVPMVMEFFNYLFTDPAQKVLKDCGFLIKQND